MAVLCGAGVQWHGTRSVSDGSYRRITAANIALSSERRYYDALKPSGRGKSCKKLIGFDWRLAVEQSPFPVRYAFVRLLGTLPGFYRLARDKCCFGTSLWVTHSFGLNAGAYRISWETRLWAPVVWMRRGNYLSPGNARAFRHGGHSGNCERGRRFRR